MTWSWAISTFWPLINVAQRCSASESVWRSECINRLLDIFNFSFECKDLPRQTGRRYAHVLLSDRTKEAAFASSNQSAVMTLPHTGVENPSITRANQRIAMTLFEDLRIVVCEVCLSFSFGFFKRSTTYYLRTVNDYWTNWNPSCTHVQ